MKTSTRLFLLLALVLAQLSSLAATVGLSLRHQMMTSQTTPARPATAVATPLLSLYPNPSKGLVMVSLEQKASENYKLRFSNIIGREVRTIALRPEIGMEGTPVNLSDLPAGVYFYSLLVNDKVVSTKRLILQN
ncbi:T9SS type A sorting domain-containing protein [Hymenobacter sp. BT635]|uniref:T9SS type A sorting domain-containing protein n=1 Tax=Hymenobacter nitidus TaxID=2880929 RepID=A0ABS8A8F6_9BACT|nr:T9SS type A sorting domain-containing protein [Hymenobacter nitidus]MCB2376017.1 T9SS type A sorting domain-containing protein [Hymenobacter nitidus]